MSDSGDIEVENGAVYDVLPKDVAKEVGNVKLFNKWDYDVEVRDISLTYVIIFPCPLESQRDFWLRLNERGRVADGVNWI